MSLVVITYKRHDVILTRFIWVLKFLFVVYSKKNLLHCLASDKDYVGVLTSSSIFPNNIASLYGNQTSN